jgi:type II secretory pathway pseudopilin PulG
MNLQQFRGTRNRPDAGYAMAALLVGLAVMAVLMSVAMPVWSHAAKREKEAELIFRGEQYARAIGLYQRKFAGSFPPNLQVLLDQKFLRRKYKDPMTPEGEFELIYQLDQGRGGATPGSTASAPGSPQPRTQVGVQGNTGGGRTSTAPGTLGARGGVIGVASKSTERSIKLHNGRGRYDQWQFVYVPVNTQPGGTGQPGQIGQPGQPGARPGQMGQPGGVGLPFGRPGQPGGRGDDPRARPRPPSDMDRQRPAGTPRVRPPG